MSAAGGRSGPTDDFGVLYRESEAMLEGLGLRRTFTLEDLHRRVEQRRDRPVHLIPRDFPALAPHGLWVAGEHADYVFYDAAAATVRQHQIIGHELGHVLYDHSAAPTAVEDTAAVLLPDVVPGGPARVYQRTSYDLPAERRAEVFGTVVVQRLHSWRPLRPTADPEALALLARVSAALQGGRET